MCCGSYSPPDEGYEVAETHKDKEEQSMSKYIDKLDELNHLLLAIWCNDLYETQIHDIVEHYGREAVLRAETILYDSRVFELIVS